MPVETLGARAALFAAAPLATAAIGLALLATPCPAQTPMVTAGRAHPVRMENPVITTSTTRESPQPIAADTIRPFEIHVPEEELVELRRRIAATRWPDGETVSDATQGVQLATMQRLAHYWATDYDWRRVEARLNALPQFVTTIDGLDIHFIHVRSKHPNALPVIITHGWPGSIIEQLKIIDPLTNRRRMAGMHPTLSMW